MRRLAVHTWCSLMLVLVACSQPSGVEPGPFTTLKADAVSELYFSEYVEGSSNNKALEIFNGTRDDVDLSDYRVEMYFNGSTSDGLSINLEGQLAAGDVYVVAHADAVGDILAAADQTVRSGFYNGDDVIMLRRPGAIIDTIGQVGLDPGSQWGSGLTSTADSTLRRLQDRCAGDTDPSDEFAPASQWAGFDTDTFSDLGTHSSTCKPGRYLASPRSDPNAVTPIYEVQGEGGFSPFEGQTVTIRGVVVGDFQEYGELSGFFIHELEGDDREETSDGIFVYHYDTEVNVGDEVEVTGEVDEYFGLTEITDVTVVEVIGESEPEPYVVTLPLDDESSWERYEGMLIELKSSTGQLVATEVYDLGRGGVVKLADERLVTFTQLNEPSTTGYAAHVKSIDRRSILLDDGSLWQNPDPNPYSTTGTELTADDTLRVGDKLAPVTGVVSYSWGGDGWRRSDAYRIHPTRGVEFTPSNPRPHQPPAVGGRVQVASFNVLNFFNGDGMGNDIDSGRGADNAFELERQLDKLVSAIVPLDADVLGLVEIENDASAQSALADLVEALNREAGAGTYAYIDTGVIGSDEIKVALVYQPAEVNPTGHYRVLNSTISNDYYALDPRFDDTKNRPALAQTFVEKGTGARFTVIVNHLKSKGSSCSGDGDRGDGQGNCNMTRAAAAEALADWSELLAQESGDPDVLIMGDLNAYAMEDPIQALLANGFENLLDSDEYSYVFRGESGTLDHALATPSLAAQVVDTEVWGINAEEPSVLDYNTNFKSARHVDLLYSDSAFRASDHDPVIIGLDLTRTPRVSSQQ